MKPEREGDKEAERERKTEGKGTEREVILAFFSAPRGGLFIQGLKEGQNTRPCYNEGDPQGMLLSVCVCGGGAALSRPLSGLIALEYSSLRAGSDHGGLLEG